MKFGARPGDARALHPLPASGNQIVGHGIACAHHGAASNGISHAEAWTDRSRLVPTPEARAANRAAIEDEARFIDFARSTMWLSKEHVLVDRW